MVQYYIGIAGKGLVCKCEKDNIICRTPQETLVTPTPEKIIHMPCVQKCETVRGAITSQKLLLLLLRESPIMTALLKMQNYSHSWPFMIWWSLVVFTISTLLVWCRNWLHLACELCGCQVFHPGLGSGHVACSSKNRLKRDRFLLGKSDGI